MVGELVVGVQAAGLLWESFYAAGRKGYRAESLSVCRRDAKLSVSAGAAPTSPLNVSASGAAV